MESSQQSHTYHIQVCETGTDGCHDTHLPIEHSHTNELLIYGPKTEPISNKHRVHRWPTHRKTDGNQNIEENNNND